jgi:hypothetical protein
MFSSTSAKCPAKKIKEWLHGFKSNVSIGQSIVPGAAARDKNKLIASEQSLLKHKNKGITKTEISMDIWNEGMKVGQNIMQNKL